MSRTIATSVDEYQPSLWHYVGQLRAKFALQSLVDQYFYDRSKGRNPKYPVILLTGDFGWGRRTLARAIHSAMGNLEFREPAHLLGSSEDLVEFFEGSIDSTSFYVPNIAKLSITSIGQLIYVIRDGICYRSEFPNPRSEKVSVGNRLIILSADRNEVISPDILRHVSLRCDMPGYTNPQIKEILRQRVVGLNWSTSDMALEIITRYSCVNPGKAMRLLSLCRGIAAANNDDVIDLEYVKKAIAVE